MTKAWKSGRLAQALNSIAINTKCFYHEYALFSAGFALVEGGEAPGATLSGCLVVLILFILTLFERACYSSGYCEAFFLG